MGRKFKLSIKGISFVFIKNLYLYAMKELQLTKRKSFLELEFKENRYLLFMEREY